MSLHFRGQLGQVGNTKINKKFIHDKFSLSKNVLRGFHGDKKTWKLISCVYGKFYLLLLTITKK